MPEILLRRSSRFDPAGNVVNSGATRTSLIHACTAVTSDKDGNIWIASAPSGMVQKYSRDGSKLLLQLGKKGVFEFLRRHRQGHAAELERGASSSCRRASTSIRRTATSMSPTARVAGGNKRIAVMDRDGKFLRQWQPAGMERLCTA
jgi:hypothetical protein